MGFWIFGSMPELTIKYQTEYIFAKKALAQWRKFRPTSSVTGMAASYSIRRYESAVHAQAHGYHLVTWGRVCSCGIEVSGASEGDSKSLRPNVIFESKGHLDYWAQAYTYLFITAETVKVRGALTYEPFNFKWQCQLCNHKEQALKNEDGTWVKPGHYGVHPVTIEPIFKGHLAQRDFRNGLVRLFEAEGLVSEHNRYEPDED